MKCDCYAEKATLLISKILAELNNKPENNPNNRELDRWKKRMELAVDLLKEQQKKHFEFQINYAKELNEAKKLFVINTKRPHEPISLDQPITKEKKKRRTNKKKVK